MPFIRSCVCQIYRKEFGRDWKKKIFYCSCYSRKQHIFCSLLLSALIDINHAAFYLCTLYDNRIINWFVDVLIVTHRCNLPIIWCT